MSPALRFRGLDWGVGGGGGGGLGGEPRVFGGERRDLSSVFPFPA